MSEEGEVQNEVYREVKVSVSKDKVINNGGKQVII